MRYNGYNVLRKGVVTIAKDCVTRLSREEVNLIHYFREDSNKSLIRVLVSVELHKKSKDYSTFANSEIEALKKIALDLEPDINGLSKFLDLLSRIQN